MSRILIADDHSIVRYGLLLTLQKHFPDYSFEEAWDGETVMKQLEQQAYDLVLLDLNMPDTDPGILLHWLKTAQPHIKVLVLSMNEERLFGLRSIQLGAKGYLKKDTPHDQIAAAVKTVLSGKKYVSPELAETILTHAIEGRYANPFERLSTREFQVAMYIVQDYSVRQISDMLQLQYATVNTFKQRIYEKLELKHRKELLEMAAAYSFARN
jgi:two-component system invasion response regulator UvrY